MLAEWDHTCIQTALLYWKITYVHKLHCTTFLGLIIASILPNNSRLLDIQLLSCTEAVFSPQIVQGMTEGCGWGVIYGHIKALILFPTSKRNLYWRLVGENTSYDWILPSFLPGSPFPGQRSAGVHCMNHPIVWIDERMGSLIIKKNMELHILINPFQWHPQIQDSL